MFRGHFFFKFFFLPKNKNIGLHSLVHIHCLAFQRFLEHVTECSSRPVEQTTSHAETSQSVLPEPSQTEVPDPSQTEVPDPSQADIPEPNAAPENIEETQSEPDLDYVHQWLSTINPSTALPEDDVRSNSTGNPPELPVDSEIPASPSSACPRQSAEHVTEVPITDFAEDSSASGEVFSDNPYSSPVVHRPDRHHHESMAQRERHDRSQANRNDNQRSSAGVNTQSKDSHSPNQSDPKHRQLSDTSSSKRVPGERKRQISGERESGPVQPKYSRGASVSIDAKPDQHRLSHASPVSHTDQRRLSQASSVSHPTSHGPRTPPGTPPNASPAISSTSRSPGHAFRSPGQSSRSSGQALKSPAYSSRSVCQLMDHCDQYCDEINKIKFFIQNFMLVLQYSKIEILEWS